MLIFVFTSCLTSLLMCCIVCHTIRDTNRLLRDKLADYNKNTRPTFDQSKQTVVNYRLEIIYIQEFDEVKQKFSFNGLPRLSWIDEEMRWNPAEYGGLDSLLTASGPFWKPDLTLANSVGGLEPISDEEQKIRFLPNGYVSYKPGKLFSSACDVDVTFYPFDIHTCHIIFTPHGHRPDEVLINVENTKVGQKFFLENGDWKLIDSHINVSLFTFYSELTVYITIERKPRYAIVNVILPIIFLAYLNNVVFVIPAECGERISYSITVLLAIAVYLTIVGDNLPKTSFPMAYFSYYLLALLITSICITLATIFNLRIYHYTTSDPVTGCWEKITSCLICRKTKRKKNEVENTNVKIGIQNLSNRENMHYDRNRSVHNLYLPSSKQQKRLSDRQQFNLEGTEKGIRGIRRHESDKTLTWKDVSVALDKLFFVGFFIIFSAATIFYVLIIVCERKRL
ncbi:neuronal acetylcholine receptor subunit alpha-6-like [Ruditapes philippinarum]|uniref:neuronal acetylcholine receptor subunit alpha-6-like n=1 Tax=Ruditapes philippinarum TaxID=129788 RepID=UPI00295BF23C|nr:neuronal acetylcholine receptor subunit alpha-6-like [Ruditapes philippinarum]